VDLTWCWDRHPVRW